MLLVDCQASSIDNNITRYKPELSVQKQFYTPLLCNNPIDHVKKTLLPVSTLLAQGNFFKSVFFVLQAFLMSYVSFLQYKLCCLWHNSLKRNDQNKVFLRILEYFFSKYSTKPVLLKTIFEFKFGPNIRSSYICIYLCNCIGTVLLVDSPCDHQTKSSLSLSIYVCVYDCIDTESMLLVDCQSPAYVIIWPRAVLTYIYICSISNIHHYMNKANCIINTLYIYIYIYIYRHIN